MSLAKTKSFKKQPATPPSRIALAPKDLLLLQQTIFLQRHHQQIIDDLDRQMKARLDLGYQVDMDSGLWKIDLAEGVVVRNETAAPKVA